MDTKLDNSGQSTVKSPEILSTASLSTQNANSTKATGKLSLSLIREMREREGMNKNYLKILFTLSFVAQSSHLT